jgi:hypothetical protein
MQTMRVLCQLLARQEDLAKYFFLGAVMVLEFLISWGILDEVAGRPLALFPYESRHP